MDRRNILKSIILAPLFSFRKILAQEELTEVNEYDNVITLRKDYAVETYYIKDNDIAKTVREDYLGKWSEKKWYKKGIVQKSQYWINNEDHYILRNETFFENGILSRKDGPAIIDYYSTGETYREQWLVKNKLFRLNGLPAIVLY